MPVKLYSLRHVPDDEAREIRKLLQDHEIDFYETPEGNWGISAGAFWLRDAAQQEQAQQLLAEFHRQRAVKSRLEYEQLKAQGRARSFGDIIRENPLRFVLYIAAIIFILYLSLKPFLMMGRG